MSNPTPKEPDIAAKDRYTFACRAREIELDLFWKRSLFFWGFIGAAFVAFAALRDNLRQTAVIASFGFVCSVVWTLANRGSKFWYENWEEKLKKSEISITGRWYGYADQPDDDTWWLKGRRFSVSRLAITLSDYVAVLWLVLLTSRVVLLALPNVVSETWRNRAAEAFALGSIVYAVWVWSATRYAERSKVRR